MAPLMQCWCIAGDIDAETARSLVEKYFGDIEAGPPLTRAKANAPQA